MGNIFTVTLPDIGEGVVEGEVIEWLKKVNDLLEQDEPVVVVMTDKATVELPAPYPGKLVKQYFQPGQMSIKDKPLYDIELEGEVTLSKQSESLPAKTDKKIISKNIPPKKNDLCVEAENVSCGKILATPSTRDFAKKMGIDIHQIAGTGNDGRITARDVKTFVTKDKKETSPLLSLAGDTIEPIIGIRNIMLKRMTESKELIPHFSYFESLDATRLVKLRAKVSDEASKENIKVTYMPFFIRAISLTIKKFPFVNSSVDAVNHQLILHQQHNVGIAISTPLGLIVPVLKNIQDLSMRELIKAFEDLKTRALTSKLSSSDMKEATITISNFGVLGGGGLWATPIINYPEVAILGVSRIQKQPFVKNDIVEVRDMLNLSWSFDHRVLDGERAAAVSAYFSALLHNPAQLL